MQTNHVSDNDEPLGSATASTRSWWMDQSCSSKLLRRLCSCALHQLRRQGDFFFIWCLVLPLRCKSVLRFSEKLRSIDLHFATDVLGQPVGPVLNVKLASLPLNMVPRGCPYMSVTNSQSALPNIPEMLRTNLQD